MMRRPSPRLARPLALAATAALLLGACSPKGQEATTAAAPAGAPGKANGPAMAPEQPARIVGGANSQPSGQSQPAADDSAPSGQMPPGHPPIGATPASGGAPAGAPGGGGRITGTITLSADRVADVKPGTVLFIIVRRDAGEGQKGMLIASKRVDVTGAAMFPLAFDIGPENVMMGGNSLDGQVRVEARIDGDGDAISKNPGDVVGARSGALTVGAGTAADFSLNEKL